MECAWQTVFLLPIDNGEFLGIGIVKFLWKALLGVVKRRIGTAVNFQDMLHGFLVVRMTRTPSLDAKLLQQLTEMREKVLYEISLDL